MTITTQIYEQILKFNNSPFSATDFITLADVDTIRTILARFEESGKIRRLLRGIYHQPKFNEFLDEYELPSPEAIADAIARKHNWTIAPSGNTAINLLGLSTQVPAKFTFISDGPYRTFTYENIHLEFKHTTNKNITGFSPKTSLVIQAFKSIGKNKITDQIISILKNKLTNEEKVTLLIESQKSTAWIYKHIKQICLEDPVNV